MPTTKEVSLDTRPPHQQRRWIMLFTMQASLSILIVLWALTGNRRKLLFAYPI